MGESQSKQESVTPNTTTGEIDWENFDNVSWASEEESKSKADLLEVIGAASEWALAQAAAKQDVRAITDPERFQQGWGQFAVKMITQSLRQSLQAQHAETGRLLDLSDAELAAEVRIGANSSRTAVIANVVGRPESFKSEGVFGSVNAGMRLDAVLKAPFLSCVPAAKPRQK